MTFEQNRQYAEALKREIERLESALDELKAKKSAGKSVTKKIKGWMLDRVKLHGEIIGFIKGRREKGDSDEDLKEFIEMETRLATEEKEIRKLC